MQTSTEAKVLCAAVKSGEIILFDKAYVDFKHLFELNSRDIFWVTRAKDNMAYTVIKQRLIRKSGILSDEIVQLTGPFSQQDYPTHMRLITAEVEVNGNLKIMRFVFSLVMRQHPTHPSSRLRLIRHIYQDLCSNSLRDSMPQL